MKQTRAKSCTGKHRHNSRFDALYHIKRLRKKDGAVRMHPYKCKFCKMWHVGHFRLPR